MSVDTHTAPPATEPAPAPDPAPAAKTPAQPVEDPHSSLTATLAAGGPAVALILGCWLLHEFGPWLLLGAILLAAIVAAVAIRALWRRTRKGAGALRSPLRARAPWRSGSGRAWKRSGGGASKRSGSGALRSGAGGGRSRSGSALRASKRGAGALRGGSAARASAGKRSAARSGRVNRGAPAAKRNPDPRRSTAGSAARQSATAARKNTPARAGSGNPRSATPRHGLLRRAAARAGNKVVPSRRRATAAAKTAARQAAAQQRRRTGSGRRKQPIPAGAGVAAAKAAGRSRGASALRRRMTRRNMARHAATLRHGGRALRRGARHASRLTSGALSPLLVHATLRTGRALGWAHRHLRRLAAATNGPAGFPAVARGMAAGIARVMNAGRWLSRRKSIAAWMLRHHIATSGGTVVTASAARAGRKLVSLAKAPTAKPGTPIRLAAPYRPSALIGALMSASHVDGLADSFDQFVGQYEPESVKDLTAHLEQYAPLFEAFASSFARLADRLHDDYEVEPGVIDMLQQLGSANAGMTDLCNDVVTSWRTEQEADLYRHEQPRGNESTFWNVQPGDDS